MINDLNTDWCYVVYFVAANKGRNEKYHTVTAGFSQSSASTVWANDVKAVLQHNTLTARYRYDTGSLEFTRAHADNFWEVLACWAHPSKKQRWSIVTWDVTLFTLLVCLLTSEQLLGSPSWLFVSRVKNVCIPYNTWIIQMYNSNKRKFICSNTYTFATWFKHMLVRVCQFKMNENKVNISYCVAFFRLTTLAQAALINTVLCFRIVSLWQKHYRH